MLPWKSLRARIWIVSRAGCRSAGTVAQAARVRAAKADAAQACRRRADEVCVSRTPIVFFWPKKWRRPKTPPSFAVRSESSELVADADLDAPDRRADVNEVVVPEVGHAVHRSVEAGDDVTALGIDAAVAAARGA